MKESAYEWGRRHGSCIEALKAREALGPEATQADWWRVCPRGDWLLWQWECLPADGRAKTRPAIQRAVEHIVARAIYRGRKALRGVRSAEATAWRLWARRWLNGEDRTSASALAAIDWVPSAAANAAARSAFNVIRGATYYVDAAAAAASIAYAAEMRRQARDIRCELPEWPNKEG